MNFKKIFEKIFEKINKIDILKKILFLLIVCYIILAIRKYIHRTYLKESFDNESVFSEKYTLLKNTNVYDDFYSNIYDKLVFDERKNVFEIDQIVKITKPDSNSNFLDIGSGTGHHVNMLNKLGYKALGVDQSQAMISKAQSNHPGINFMNKDILNGSLFQPNSFSHITCFYFTIYYIEDKAEFFKNCYNWIKPGGFLIIHLANKNLFDPIIPAGNPFMIVSPQSYADERITSSVVKFNNFEYKSNFETSKDSDKCIMHETLKHNNNGNVRKHEHELHMLPQKKIIKIAERNGFILKNTIDLIKCNHDNQFLYILQKPGHFVGN